MRTIFLVQKMSRNLFFRWVIRYFLLRAHYDVVFIPLGSKSQALRLGVHLILLYFIRSHSQPRRFLFYLVGGGWWPTFWFFKSLDKNMVYTLCIYIYLLTLSHNFGKKCYGFKNLVKFFFFFSNQQDQESSVLINQYNKRAVCS